MLTGASGDGKSSLVYAGVLPQARAGFFKAKHNNWVVADFKPERTPLLNLSRAVANALGRAAETETVKSDLSFGFSALVDTYCNSICHLDPADPSLTAMDEKAQRLRKRKAANLLIIVDQFEEFFTNKENYSDGKCSVESQGVINVLLETVKIARQRDLPIYVICTMRSDYIGQCAAFRELPEFIGYSQFFLPRLNRSEIALVIEEPAKLNGDKITRRLVERLINSLDDGIDQLPVLQHALNQIWTCANNGAEPMDLIHFAKVGGLSKNFLADDDRSQFEQWFEALPDFRKRFYERPSLDNVLDTHANELYEQAGNLSLVTPGGAIISFEESRKIIEITFKCLTRIDDSRGVRNRMTLQEVVDIINDPRIDCGIVSQILTVFRRQGNTFLRPFVTDDASSETLTPGDILDITHESLIRNWTLLGQWTRDENESLLTFLDFEKQLRRWLANGRSKDFLLPIGPLTYFEGWFNKERPNKHWLAKYDQHDRPLSQKLSAANETLSNAKDFVRRSARRLIVSRTVLKYGANNIIAVIGIVALIASCTYFYFDYRKKQNDYVIAEVFNRGRDLLPSKFVKSNLKSDFILLDELINRGSWQKNLASLPSDSMRFDIARHMMTTALSNQDMVKVREKDNPMVLPLFKYQIDLLSKVQAFKNLDSFSKHISDILSLATESIFIKRYTNKQGSFGNPDSMLANVAENTLKYSIELLQDSAKSLAAESTTINDLILAVPAFFAYNKESVTKFIQVLSPLETTGRSNFYRLFPKEKQISQDWNHKLSHNGGFFIVSELYGLQGDLRKLNITYDSLLFYNPDFLSTEEGYCYSEIFSSLIISGSFNGNDALNFIDKVGASLKDKDPEYSALICLPNQYVENDARGYYDRRILLFAEDKTKSNNLAAYHSILNLFVTESRIKSLVNIIISQIKCDKSITANKKNFELAWMYKIRAYNCNVRHAEFNFDSSIEDLKFCLHYVGLVDSSYLNKNFKIESAPSSKIIRRNALIKYPFYFATDNIWNMYTISHIEMNISADIFFELICQQEQLNLFFDDPELLYRATMTYETALLKSLDGVGISKLSAEPLLKVKAVKSKIIDSDAINLVLALYYNRMGNKSAVKDYLNRISNEKLFSSEHFKDGEYGFKFYSDLAIKLTKLQYQIYLTNYPDNDEYKSGQRVNWAEIIAKIPVEQIRRNAYIATIDTFQKLNYESISISFLDSLVNHDIHGNPRFGNVLFEILGNLNTEATDQLVNKLIKEKDDRQKPYCMMYYISGLAQNGDFHKAFTSIPEHYSAVNEFGLYNRILGVYSQHVNEHYNNGWPLFYDFDENVYVSGGYENSQNITWVENE